MSFTPDQAKLVGDANLLIENGAGLELWADDLVRSSGNKDLTVAVASDGVTFLQAGKPVPVAGSSADSHDAADVDPHVWLDPKNAIIMVKNIQAALAKLDPAHAADFRQRADAYIAKLDPARRRVAAQTKDLPRKDFVSFHSAFQYYARAYGLRQVAVLEEFPGKEPSPQYLAGIVDLIKKLGVTAVFAEPQFSSRPAEALAKEVGVQVHTVDPEGAALTPDGVRASDARQHRHLRPGVGRHTMSPSATASTEAPPPERDRRPLSQCGAAGRGSLADAPGAGDLRRDLVRGRPGRDRDPDRAQRGRQDHADAHDARPAARPDRQGDHLRPAQHATRATPRPRVGYMPQRLDFDRTFPITVEEVMLLRLRKSGFWLHRSAHREEVRASLAAVTGRRPAATVASASSRAESSSECCWPTRC